MKKKMFLFFIKKKMIEENNHETDGTAILMFSNPNHAKRKKTIEKYYTECDKKNNVDWRAKYYNFVENHDLGSSPKNQRQPLPSPGLTENSKETNLFLELLYKKSFVPNIGEKGLPAVRTCLLIIDYYFIYNIFPLSENERNELANGLLRIYSIFLVPGECLAAKDDDIPCVQTFINIYALSVMAKKKNIKLF